MQKTEENKVGQIVDSTSIAKDAYWVQPPRWLLFCVILFFAAIEILFIFQPHSEMGVFKWPIIAVVSLVLFRLLTNIFRKNYLATLVADRRGLYFQTSDVTKYFFIPWHDVLEIEKKSFPLNSRGLGISVDCRYMTRASQVLGNVEKIEGKCFIYTIPQLQMRDKLMVTLESFRPR